MRITSYYICYTRLKREIWARKYEIDDLLATVQRRSVGLGRAVPCLTVALYIEDGGASRGTSYRGG